VLTRRASSPRGIALVESLVSMAILAVAVLALLGLQLQSLADAQGAARRAQAVRLIEDFSERLKAHPDAAGRLDDYLVDWDGHPAAVDCHASACDAAALARRDLRRWKRSVAQALPLGRAMVFMPSGAAGSGVQRLGVAIGWRPSRAAVDGPELDRPLALDATEPALRCPQGLVCHVAHVQP